jgi:hypothetical protein
MISKAVVLRYVLMVVVLTVAKTAASRGQEVTQQGAPAIVPMRSREVCDPNGPRSARPYVDCALMLVTGKLVRGYKRELIARERHGFIPLEAIVSGDSAKYYAHEYQIDAVISNTMMDAAATATAVAWIIGRHTCHSFMCINGAPGHGVRVTAVTAVSLAVLSRPFKGAARDLAERAIWWNNAPMTH